MFKNNIFLYFRSKYISCCNFNNINAIIVKINILILLFLIFYNNLYEIFLFINIIYSFINVYNDKINYKKIIFFINY